jgi:hypothetical protein
MEAGQVLKYLHSLSSWYNRSAMPLYTKRTVIIQLQAKACMDKEQVSFEEVLETMNEWESGSVDCTNPTEAVRLAAYPEVEDKERIPTLRTDEKDFPNRCITVTYTTSFKTRKGKIIKYATVHWVAVEVPHSEYFTPNDLPEEVDRNKPADWLQPRAGNNTN